MRYVLRFYEFRKKRESSWREFEAVETRRDTDLFPAPARPVRGSLVLRS